MPTKLGYPNSQIQPIQSLVELWQDEAGIDPGLWFTTFGGAGTITRDVTEIGCAKALLDVPALSDTARLRGLHRWRMDGPQMGPNSFIKKLVIRGRVRFTLDADIDFTKSIILGFTDGATSVSAMSDATVIGAGFTLNSGNGSTAWVSNGTNKVDSVTDGGDVFNTTRFSNLEGWILYQIEHWAGAYLQPAITRFMVNNSKNGIHYWTTQVYSPVALVYPQFYIPQTAVSGGGALHVGEVQIAYYDTLLRGIGQ